MSLREMKQADFSNCNVHLWVFKIGTRNKVKNQYKGMWIEISEEIKTGLREAVFARLNEVEEALEYDILAQNNESSVLHVNADETYADQILAECSEESEDKQIKKVRYLNNAKFYVVKLEKNGKFLYAVKQPLEDWKTKKKKGFISAHFCDDQLDLDDSPSFNLSKYFDFYIWGNSVFAKNKNKMESLLSYKQRHLESFSEMLNEEEFTNVIAGVGKLSDYVNNNRMQLRRMAAVKDKGYYKDPSFIESLKMNLESLRLNIYFDDEGKIVVDNNCADIIRALLNHRLLSHHNNEAFDVPDAKRVG